MSIVKQFNAVYVSASGNVNKIEVTIVIKNKWITKRKSTAVSFDMDWMGCNKRFTAFLDGGVVTGMESSYGKYDDIQIAAQASIFAKTVLTHIDLSTVEDMDWDAYNKKKEEWNNMKAAKSTANEMINAGSVKDAERIMMERLAERQNKKNG
jgi:hypothetical protein